PMALHQIGSLTGESPRIVVNQFSFDTPYPNPFNPVTTFKYRLPIETMVSLGIYDIEGRNISTLFEGRKTAGIHTIKWNAEHFSNGVYFIKIVAGDFVKTQKLMLVK
ncbi:MAG: hypothetical protein CMF96_02065, partial [Candidatus Marinimicrobia bacterium]|nr:hypothetical protein [Candidatus Neomarinimicrobiota bacterium]